LAPDVDLPEPVARGIEALDEKCVAARGRLDVRHPPAVDADVGCGVETVEGVADLVRFAGTTCLIGIHRAGIVHCAFSASALRNFRSRLRCHSRLIASALVLKLSECSNTQTRPFVLRAPLPALCWARRRARSVVQPT